MDISVSVDKSCLHLCHRGLLIQTYTFWSIFLQPDWKASCFPMSLPVTCQFQFKNLQEITPESWFLRVEQMRDDSERPESFGHVQCEVIYFWYFWSYISFQFWTFQYNKEIDILRSPVRMTSALGVQGETVRAESIQPWEEQVMRRPCCCLTST